MSSLDLSKATSSLRKSSFSSQKRGAAPDNKSASGISPSAPTNTRLMSEGGRAKVGVFDNFQRFGSSKKGLRWQRREIWALQRCHDMSYGVYFLGFTRLGSLLSRLFCDKVRHNFKGLVTEITTYKITGPLAPIPE